MKKLILLIVISSLTIFFISCGEDKSSEVPGKSQLTDLRPDGVPDEDLSPLPPGKQEGDGEIVEITGNSATPPGKEGPDEDSGKDGDTGKDDSSKDDSGHDGDTGKDDGSNDNSGKDSDDGKDQGAKDDSGKDGDNGKDNGSKDDSGKDGDDGKDQGSKDDSGKDGDDGKDDSGKDEDTSNDDGTTGNGADKDPCNIKGNSLVRLGKDACYIEGKWYKDADTLFTYQQNQCVCFRYHNLQPGKYEIALKAKHWKKHGEHNEHHEGHHGEQNEGHHEKHPGGHHGDHPEDFKEYKIMIAADGVSAETMLPANSSEWKTSSVNLDLTGGTIDICVEWLNQHCKDNNCANFQIHSIKLKRIGKSERSAITAYLLTMQHRNKAFIVSLFLSLVIALGVIYIWNKKRIKA